MGLCLSYGPCIVTYSHNLIIIMLRKKIIGCADLFIAFRNHTLDQTGHKIIWLNNSWGNNNRDIVPSDCLNHKGGCQRHLRGSQMNRAGASEQVRLASVDGPRVKALIYAIKLTSPVFIVSKHLHLCARPFLASEVATPPVYNYLASSAAPLCNEQSIVPESRLGPRPAASIPERCAAVAGSPVIVCSWQMAPCLAGLAGSLKSVRYPEL